MGINEIYHSEWMVIIFNKIIEKKFLNLEKGMSIQVEGTYTTPNRHTRKEIPLEIVNAKTWKYSLKKGHWKLQEEVVRSLIKTGPPK